MHMVIGIGRNRAVTIVLLALLIAGEFTLDRIGVTDFALEARWILLALLALSVIVLQPKQKHKLGSAGRIFMLFAACFTLVMITSSLYSRSSEEAVMGLITYSLLFVISGLTAYCVTLFTKPNELIHFIARIFSRIGVAYSIMVVGTALLGEGRGSIVIGGPNVATRVLFMAAMSSLYLFWAMQRKLYLQTFLLCLFSIILLGSRGGIIGAGVGLTVHFLSAFFSRGYRRMKAAPHSGISLMAGLLALSIMLGDAAWRVFSNRIVDLLVLVQHSAGRDRLFYDSLELISESPLIGFGLGSYNTLLGDYPHNIFLEVALNAGIIGILAFLPIAVYSLLMVRLSYNTEYAPLGVIPLYMLIVANFSGDANDFRYFPFWVIVLLHCLHAQQCTKVRQ